MWSVALGSLDHASLASARAPIWDGCCLADWHLRRRLRPISRFFPRPSTRRQDQQPSPTGRRQREPAGRSPAPEAPARQSEANAAPGRITGGGGRGGVTKPYHAAHPRPPPQHPRQHKPHGATRPAPPNTRGSTSRTTPQTPASPQAQWRRPPPVLDPPTCSSPAFTPRSPPGLSEHSASRRRRKSRVGRRFERARTR